MVDPVVVLQVEADGAVVVGADAHVLRRHFLQTARLGPDKCCVAGAYVNAMALPLRHRHCRAVQALLGRQHVAGREALIAPRVLPQHHQIGRPAHGAQHGVELARPVAVAMRKGGHAATREGRLLPGDRVEREAWVSDDPGAVVARNGAVHPGAVGVMDLVANRSGLGGCGAREPCGNHGLLQRGS